jgi:Lysylphosphatidylglycerol synthase TM region
MKVSSPIRVIASLAVSAGLLAWLVYRVSPQALAHAAAEVDWRLLAPATVAMVFALYFWDAVCLPTAYRVDDNRWSYWRSLHLRGLSYLFGSLHYELGQAALAWGMARTQNTSVVRMLSRSVLLAYHDIVVLLGLGFAGSLLSDDPRVERVRPALAIAFSIAIAIAIVFWLLPATWRTKLWGAKIDELFAGWNLARSLQLVPLRCVYFSIFAVYAAVALAICRIPVDHKVVASTIPLVLLADGLPSIAGLGTRDTALQLLLTPDKPEALLAMSLMWSTGLIVVRSIIGLTHLWGHQLLYGSIDESVP